MFAGPGRHRRLLIHRQHQRVDGRGQRQPAHVRGALPERRVLGAGQPGTDQVRLDVELGQDSPDLRRGDPHIAQVVGQQPMRPLRLHLRASRGDRGHDLEPLVMAIQTRPARAGHVLQAGHPVFVEPAPPQPHRVLRQPHLGSDPTVRPPLGGQQHHLRPADHPLQALMRPHHMLQALTLGLGDQQRLQDPHDRPLLLGKWDDHTTSQKLLRRSTSRSGASSTIVISDRPVSMRW
jgi:hypothetical protein